MINNCQNLNKMVKEDFESFLNKESGKVKKTINWEEKLTRWKSFINSLYLNINEWLKEYVKSGKIEIDTYDIEIYEEAIGKYTVRAMKIKLGDNIVKLIPIGTVLIGTIGRVDVVGESGTQKIILADKNATGPKIETNEFVPEKKKQHDERIIRISNTPVDWKWKFTSNPPRIKYTELNQESFFECLMNVING